ncbi:hypothetical protein BDW75DRAFT_252117 [Aspergillus navahoensis]
MQSALDSPDSRSRQGYFQDLLKRHAAGHSHSQDGKRKRASSYSRNGRVSQACKACATSKLKCDEEKPCRRCRDRKLFCDYVDGSAQDAEQQGSDDEHGQDEEYSPLESQPFSPLNPAMRVQQLVTPDGLHPYPHMMASHARSRPGCKLTQAPAPTVSPLVDHDGGVFSVDGTFFPEFIPDSLVSLSRPGELDPSAFPPNDYYARRLYDHNLSFDFDLTEVDFGLIDFYNSRGSANPAPLQPDDNDRDADRDSGIALGAEAYSRSSLSAWKPVRSDHAFADQNDLSVPKSIDSPDATAQSRHQILSERLSPGSRDLIFGMVLQTSQRANLTRIMKSFPSTELLDSLIQDFFAYQAQQVDSWIHGPTFHPNEESPDMVGIVAAAAAVKSGIPTIRKLGYALMEVVRLQMSLKYENDNTTIRDLRASQTFALTIDIGMWSGSGRRTEIAESFQQPLLTMLRRGLRFRRSLYTPIIPSLDDTPSTLERKWRDWAEQESFKRLVHHLFLHDAQSSLMLNINPLISYADLELPLPMVRALWEAESANEWRDIYIATSAPSPSPERLPSLVDTLRDMSTYQGRIDHQLSALVILHGLSALINEYHRLKFIAQGNSKHWNALVINSRQQELEHVLQHFRMISADTDPPFMSGRSPSPEISLLHEVISMFLFMSLEDLQLFAGKEDRNEARRVYNSALEWIGSVDSRKAIWHAGQAIRAARAMSLAKEGSLTGFRAISVYYASLAFWSYGVVSRARRSKLSSSTSAPTTTAGAETTTTTALSPNSGLGSSTSTSSSEPLIFLDGEETTDVHRFISLARGRPALGGCGLSDGPALVSDPGKVMDVAQGLLRGDPNAQTPYEALPPLVQGLCQLMHGLGKP